MKLLFSILVGWCLLCSSVWGADPSYLQMPVSKVTSSSFRAKDLDLISRSLGIEVGKKLNPATLNEGLQRVVRAGTIQSLFVRGVVEGKTLSLLIDGTRIRKIRKIEFNGVETDILESSRQGLSLEEGKSSDMREFGELRDRLRKAYEQRGYLFCEVTVTIQEVPESDDADVLVSVVKGDPSIVNEVKVQTGDSVMDEELLSLVPLKKGDIFSQLLLEEGTEKINSYLSANQYPTSKVDSAKFEYSDDKQRVSVTILVKLEERYQFQFNGNLVFADIQLRGLITDKILSQVDSSQRIAELIKKKYRDVGYHFVQVETVNELQKNEKLNIVRFEIEEGPRVRVDKFNLTGAEKVGKSKIERMFFQGAPGVLGRRVFEESALPVAQKNLQEQLVEDGYLSSSVSSPRAIFTEDREGVEIFLEVDVGTRTFIKSLEVIGAKHVSEVRVRELLGVKVGEPINRHAVEEGQKRILKEYFSQGYIDAKFNEKVPVIELTNSRKDARITLNIVEGTQYFVGQVNIAGNVKTQERVIRREIKLSPGDKFSPELLQDSEEDIALLGLFSRVEIVQSESEKGKQYRDLNVVVRERKPGLGELGFGGLYEEPLVKLRTFLGVGYRNVMGLNHTASVRSEVSLPFSDEEFIPFVEYSAVLGYRAPYPFEVPVTFSTQAGLDSKALKLDPVKLQRRVRLEAKIEKKLSATFTLLYRLYRFETTTTEDRSTTPATLTVDTIGSTGPGLIFDFRDDIFNPTTGSYHTVDVEFAHPALLSEDKVAFVMGISRNSFYIPIFKPFQLNLFAGIGYAKSLFGDAGVPTARLAGDLSLGGYRTLRGFKLRQFSPADGVFSTAYYNARAELITDLFSNIALAIFIDTGQIFPNLTTQPRHDGIGFGFRYRTPVGPIVIDVAQGLGADSTGIKFYFTIGTF